MDKMIDRLYIGTGPINIADAFFHAQNGESIVLLDGNPVIGGAWIAIEVGEYGKLEIGCHIWSFNRKVYLFLDDFLGLDLVKMDPQPYFLKGRSKILYDYKNLLLSSKKLGNHLLKGKFKLIKHELLNNPGLRFPILPKTYEYPRGGAREFQEKLIEKIKSTTVDIQLNKEIEQIEYKNGVWTSILTNGETIQSKQIRLTASTALKKITFNGQTYPFDITSLDFTHFHLVFKGELAKKLAYIRVLDHALIHRISDISTQLDEKTGSNLSVLLVGVRATELKRYETDAEVIEVITKYLKEISVLKAENTLEFSQKNSFKTAYIPEEMRDEINSLHPSIELAGTTDLMYGFRRQMQKWKAEGFI